MSQIEIPTDARPGEDIHDSSQARSVGRVLFLAPMLAAGGVTTHMISLARKLQSCGWQVAIATGGSVGQHSHTPAYLASMGIEHFHIPFNRTRSTVRHLTGALHALVVYRNVVRHYQPDLVHVHWRSVSWFAALSRFRYRIPFVVTLNQVNIPSSWFYRVVSFWGDHTIAVSRQAQNDLMDRFKIPVSRVSVVYNGVDESHFRPPTPAERSEARSKLGIRSDQEPIVCMIASLEYRKRHDLLLQAMGKLKQDGLLVKALMAGSGALASQLKQGTEELGLSDQVHWLGFSDIRTVLHASDLLVLPSEREAFPISIVEAMACGVVPIRTPTGGADEQITHQQNGLIMPFDDSETLADHLKYLIQNPETRREMAVAAVQTVREFFTSQRMVDQVGNIYKGILGKY